MLPCACSSNPPTRPTPSGFGLRNDPAKNRAGRPNELAKRAETDANRPSFPIFEVVAQDHYFAPIAHNRSLETHDARRQRPLPLGTTHVDPPYGNRGSTIAGRMLGAIIFTSMRKLQTCIYIQVLPCILPLDSDIPEIPDRQRQLHRQQAREPLDGHALSLADQLRPGHVGRPFHGAPAHGVRAAHPQQHKHNAGTFRVSVGMQGQMFLFRHGSTLPAIGQPATITS